MVFISLPKLPNSLPKLPNSLPSAEAAPNGRRRLLKGRRAP